MLPFCGSVLLWLCPCPIIPSFHHSIIPIFQYSNIPIFRYSITFHFALITLHFALSTVPTHHSPAPPFLCPNLKRDRSGTAELRPPRILANSATTNYELRTKNHKRKVGHPSLTLPIQGEGTDPPSHRNPEGDAQQVGGDVQHGGVPAGNRGLRQFGTHTVQDQRRDRPSTPPRPASPADQQCQQHKGKAVQQVDWWVDPVHSVAYT